MIGRDLPVPQKKIFIIAGETSGDVLGAKLMHALRAAHENIVFSGIGGEMMQAEGLSSLFPMSDIAVMGFVPVIKRLPLLLNRIRWAGKACLAAEPDVLVIIDSPDFCHRVAKRVRAAAPHIPIVNYVSPTVWAWRPGRAKKIRPFVDHLLALLPFEPAAHARLGGPLCTYVGHPLVERLDVLRPNADEAVLRSDARHVLLLPGSRMSEVTRLLPIFGDVVLRLAQEDPQLRFQLPVVPHVEDAVREAVVSWPVQPEIIRGEAAKFSAFRSARAALAASGTVTLELGLAGIPTVAVYKVSAIEEAIVRAVIQVSSVLLPNIILNRPVVPELLQQDATAENMVTALKPLIFGGAERESQLAAFRELDRAMQVPGGNPSRRAAEIILKYIQ